ncbi:MAG: hypothetical protein P1U40_10835 [Coxiellaceae bacterium]|nr:hypothetical protein [Coxiellaceae bacterium]
MTKAFETVSWNDIKHRVEQLNPELFSIIDEIAPPLPIMLVRYPYGITISDPQHYHFPKAANLTPLSALNSPYCFLLENTVETYLHNKDKIIPGTVFTPGDFFPQNFELNRNIATNVRPSSIFYLASGARNINMMPMYQDNESYRKLARHFKIPARYSPKNVADHQPILTYVSNAVATDWHCCMLLFDEKWKENIFNNPKWFLLREYIFKQSIKANASKRNSFYLEHAINDTTKARHIKAKPFSMEMIKYILSVALGDTPGMRPATDDTALPMAQITQAFNEIYAPPTTPIIIEPCRHNPLTDSRAVYHSLSAATFNINDPKSFRPLTYLSEIAENLSIYLKAFKKHPFTKATVFGHLSDAIQLDYYSVLGDAQHIKEASELLNDDSRFNALYETHKEYTNYGFAKRSIFTKALVSVKINSKKLTNHNKEEKHASIV